MKALFEIFVPTVYADTKGAVSTKHHIKWDEYIMSITGGMTIGTPSKGKWISPSDGYNYAERVIPVKIFCEESDIEKIVEFTKKHYRQEAVMYYEVTRNVKII